MLCKECDKSLPEEYSYCPYCGTGKGATLAESMDNEKSDRRRLAELAISERVFKKVLTWFGVLGSILVIAATIVSVQLSSVLQNAREQVETRTKAAIGQITSAENQS